MPETTITCPNCGAPVELTAAMKASIEATVRAQYEAQAARARNALAEKEKALAAQAAELQRAAAAIEEQVAAKLGEERAKLAQKAKAAAMEEFRLELKSLQEQLEEKSRKLTDAEARELALRKRERELEEKAKAVELDVARRLDEERDKIAEKAKQEATESLSPTLKALQQELEAKRDELVKAQQAELALRLERSKLEEEKQALALEVQRQIDQERQRIREDAQRQLSDEFRLKMAEKDKQIADMLKQIEDLKRKGEQGSQQIQGEVQELDLEAMLRAAFPRDTIEPVPTGVHGGDVIQRVVGPTGAVIGTILWESKRTKTWSDGWLSKLRANQREAKAEVAAILTTALPKGIDTFGNLDGVWVTSRSCLLPLASVLRQGLIEVAAARDATTGRQTKMELLYEYMTGPLFRHRIEAIKEAFEAMQDDLAREKAMMQRQWAKREKQIAMIISGTVDMYGELQAIVGRTMPVIDGLDLPELPMPQEASTD